jgi:2-polyprenyl-3-methyl-5-hydroxy-6-metoxy-1,4-benzoquinol methylase
MHMCCCRFCGASLRTTMVDLGMSPLANAYLTAEQLHQMEPFYPLRVYVCEHCWLVQLEALTTPESIFADYAYFSSYADSWLQHAQAYVAMAVPRFGLTTTSQVIEIASNDGYLLQYFMAQGIPVLGIEPAANVAAVAQQRGIATLVQFFGEAAATQLVAQGTQADLVVANNVLAHVPQLNDFVRGLKLLLKPHGVVTLEFPHVLRLMVERQFDTIYHEHFSYFSLYTVRAVFAAHGLTLFDVDELPTHGGSLRIYARHSEDESRSVTARIANLLVREEAAGLQYVETYLAFAEEVKATKRRCLDFFLQAKQQKKSLAGYGAPAKGNTLLNYLGVRTDFLDYTVDRSPHKQGHFLPGTHIPILHPDVITTTKPDYLVILPWNLQAEIRQQMAHIRVWGGQFVTLIPDVVVYA